MSSAVVESIEIDAPPDAVWALVMDPHRLSEWVTTHRSVSDVPEGSLERDSTFRQRLSLAGAGFDVRWHVVEAERPRLAKWEGEGPRGSTAHVGYRLEAVGDGTRFHYSNEFDLPGGVLGRVAAGVVSAAGARREAKRTLANLKRIAESG